MKISMFFEFPGVLILIGVVFLVVAVIMIILSLKKKDKINDFVVPTKEEVVEEDSYDIDPMSLVDENEEKQKDKTTKQDNDEKQLEIKEVEIIKNEEQEEQNFLDSEDFIPLNPKIKEEKEQTDNSIETL